MSRPPSNASIDSIAFIETLASKSQGDPDLPTSRDQGLGDQAVKGLRIQAASPGLSMEAEVRVILTDPVANSRVEDSLKSLLLTMPNLDDDADLERTHSAMRPVDL